MRYHVCGRDGWSLATSGHDTLLLPDLAQRGLCIDWFVFAGEEMLKASWRCDHSVALYGLVDII